MAQREVLEKDGRGAVEQWATHALSTPDHVDEAALMQRLQHASHRHAAYLLDLGAAEGLPVRDERQRLERSGAEARRTGCELGALDGFRVLGAREDLPASPDLDELHAMSIDVIVFPQLIERGRNGRLGRLRVKGSELLGGNWAGAGEQRRLKQLR